MSGVRAEAMCVLRGGVFVREKSFHGHIEYNVGLPLGVGIKCWRMLRMHRLFVALRRVGVFIFDLFLYLFLGAAPVCATGCLVAVWQAGRV